MQGKVLLAAMVATSLLGAATSAAAADDRYFIVKNTNQDVSIQQVWTARAGTRDPWAEADVDYPIAPGTQSEFSMGSGDSCFYDVRVKFSDGVVQSFSNVNTCRGDRVVAD